MEGSEGEGDDAVSVTSTSGFQRPSNPEPQTPVSNFNIFYNFDTDDDDDDDIDDHDGNGNEEEGPHAPSETTTTTTTEEEEGGTAQGSSSDVEGGVVQGPAKKPRLLLDGDGEDMMEDMMEDVMEMDVDSVVGGGDEGSSALSRAIRRHRLQYEGRDEVASQDGLSDTVMAVMWGGGKMGIAYYLLDTSEVFVLPDTSESADFYILRSMFLQIMPRYLLLSANQDERLISVACQMCGVNLRDPETEDEEVEQSQAIASSKLVRLQGKMFNFEICKRRVLSIKLPFEPKDSNDDEHELFISSLIPIRNERMVRATGALLQYMDKRGGELFQIQLVDGHIPVLTVKLCTMNDVVMVDDTAWQSLQMFSIDIHPSTVKQVNNYGSKEGVSVFSMLNKGCSTGQGTRALRLMLLRPSRNLELLERRYAVVEFCSNPRNIEFTQSVMDCLKSIKSLPKLLYKLRLLHASVTEWKELYQTLSHSVLLGELCFSQSRHRITLFNELGDSENLDILRSLSQQLAHIIDFDESAAVNRIVTRTGIYTDIDRKKQQLSCLPEIMELVGNEEITNLPGFIRRCTVVYFPEVGYLLAVDKWRENLTREDIDIDGLDYKFMASDSVYFKTPRTKELDLTLGDCSVAILEKETTVMIYLTEQILGHSSVILKVGSLVAELDCLISMAAAARNGNFVRPLIVPGGEKLKILNGVHPLAAELCEFVPNTTHLNGEQRVVMITGPNASGKSVYLKQVAVISLMALSGSFVPAQFAQIPTFDRLCTRIHATESVSLGFSSFMIDLNQMSLALRTTTKKSLVIIDEFGKGTAEADGLSLLAASVEDFLQRGENSPIVFLSTHFASLINYISTSPIFKMQSMKFLQQNDETYHRITYLYELIDGVCRSSLAHLVAEQTGISRQLILRSEDVERVIRNQFRENWLVPIETIQQTEMTSMLRKIGTVALELDFESIDPTNFFCELKNAFESLSS